MSFTHIGSAEAGGSTGSPSITHGQTISDGNLVFMYANSNSSTSMSADAGGSTWNELVDETPSSESARQGLWWKIAGSSEPSSYSITSGSAQWRVIVRVFSSATAAVIDASATTARTASNSINSICGAIDGAVLSDDCLSVVFCGKDNRSVTDTYTTADNSYIGVIGDHDGQDAVGAYRIYTTGTTFSGSVTITATAISDNTYSTHVSFVEGTGGGGVTVPLIVNHLKNQGVM